MGGKMLKKIADFEKVVHRKIVHHDEFCYRLKLMYLFLLHVVCTYIIQVTHVARSLETF
jgi:hypothetical protein